MKTKINLIFVKRLFLILSISIFTTGCASSGSVKAINPTNEKLSNYKTMVINVTSDGPKADKEITQLSSMIVAKLQEKNLFDKIYLSQFSPEAVADLKLNVSIMNLRRVSENARSLVGALAGQAGMQISATIIDTGANKSIGSFVAQGKSSGGSVFAGGTEQAIERAAEQISEFISGNM